MNDQRVELLKYFDRDEELVIFDIGACECEDSIEYVKMFPNAKIYAIEPINENFKQCLRKVNAANMMNNISVYELAISNTNGSQPIFVSSGCPEHLKNTSSHNYGNKSSSLLEPKEHLNIHKWCKFDKGKDVKTMTLDRFCNMVGVNKIDIIHIDVQGNELNVFSGSLSILNTIKVIYSEVSNIEFYKNQVLKKDLVDFLRQYMFSPVLDTAGNDNAGDILFVQNNFLANLKR